MFLGDIAKIYNSAVEHLCFSYKLPVSVLKRLDWQGNLADGRIKDETFLCNLSLDHILKIEPTIKISDVVMFYLALNIKLGVDLLKINHPNLTVICGFEQGVSLLFKYLIKTPISNHIIRYHKAI